MAEEPVEFIPIEKKLGDIFREAFQFFLHINESSEPTNSPDFQVSHTLNCEIHLINQIPLITAPDPQTNWQL